MAIRIGAGQPITDTILADTDHPQQMAECVEQLCAWGISVVVTQPSAYALGVEAHNHQIQETVHQFVARGVAKQKAMRGAVVDNMALASVSTARSASQK